LFTSHNGQLLCGAVCRRRRQSRLTAETIKRRYREDVEFRDQVISKAQNRRVRDLGLDEITRPAALLTYLMERDRKRCGICREPIRAKTGPRRPSVDHIVPLSRGGQHELSNLQAAHYVCNLAKNNGGGGEQLLLVG
jgi:5-methylcytosine-specific restriction endonuclease McrA